MRNFKKNEDCPDARKLHKMLCYAIDALELKNVLGVIVIGNVKDKMCAYHACREDCKLIYGDDGSLKLGWKHDLRTVQRDRKIVRRQ